MGYNMLFSMRRNLGDGCLSSNDEDDVTVTAELEDSVQIEVFGSPEVNDESAAAAVPSLPPPFSRTGRVRIAIFSLL